MQSRTLLLAALSLGAPCVVLPEVARADRRTGLAGNVLIEDPDDLFPFPQATLQHRNMIRLDYGGSSTSGNGVLTLGNELQAVAISAHRGDLLSPDVVGFDQELAWLGGVGNPFTNVKNAEFLGPDDLDLARSTEQVLPATVLDLSYARALGRDSIGVRFGFGRGVQALRDKDSGIVTKGAQTFFAAQLGYSSLPLDKLRYDASASLLFAFGKAVVEDSDVQKGWDLRIGALARGYYPINRLVDLGVLAHLSFDEEHARADVADERSNDFEFGMLAGVGPVIRLDRAKIAAYGGLRMAVGKNEPDSTDGADEQQRLRFAAPMLNMAAEVQLLDWLYARTGAEYSWQVTRAASEAQAERVSDGAFRWSAGLGLRKASFSFDGVVKNGFVTGGPNFIGGNADGFLAMASLTYKFGDVFGSSATPLAAAPSPPGESVQAP